jgi:isoleucyl-tRNA synthetase
MGSQISDEITGQLGAEIVRLWVASVDFREDVVASLPLLRRLAEEIYRKLRNTFRFLLGSLREIDPSTGQPHDFDPASDSIAFDAMQPIDQYILARAAELTAKITKAYADFEFHRVYHLLNEFCNSELSAFYLDVLKDRLYTYPIKFKPGHDYQRDLYLARRSAQTAIYKITDALARLTAPILSFTADEVWQSLPHTPDHPASVHLTLFPTPESLAPKVHTSQLIADWETLLAARNVVLQQLEGMRTRKEIGKALDAEFVVEKQAELNARYDIHNANLSTRLLKQNENTLAELFGLSSVSIMPVETLHESIAQFAEGHPQVSGHPKCDRCWRHVPDVGDDTRYPTVCLRCAQALDAIDFPPYPAASPSTNN